jgi:hypothetical protein
VTLKYLQKKKGKQLTAELKTDETGDEIGCDWEVSGTWEAEGAEAAGVLEGTGEETPVEGSAAAPTAPA